MAVVARQLQQNRVNTRAVPEIQGQCDLSTQVTIIGTCTTSQDAIDFDDIRTC